MISIAKGAARCRGCGAPIDLFHMAASDHPTTLSMLGCGSPLEPGDRVWFGVIVDASTSSVEIGFACSEGCATLLVETSTK